MIFQETDCLVGRPVRINKLKQRFEALIVIVRLISQREVVLGSVDVPGELLAIPQAQQDFRFPEVVVKLAVELCCRGVLGIPEIVVGVLEAEFVGVGESGDCFFSDFSRQIEAAFQLAD